MPRFIYSTDHHFHHIGPVKRSDDYAASLLLKLEETVQLSNDEHCDAMLFGGDFFNSASPSPKLIRSIVQILNGCDAPIWAILGNHDVPGNVEAVEDRILGLLREFSEFPINYIDPNKVVVIKNVSIKGVHYYRGIEKDLLRLNSAPKPNTMLMVHANIVDRQCPFDHCNYNNLKLQALLTLTSHYHPQLGVIENSNGNVFISPGGFSRLTVDDIQRVPAVALIDIEGADYSSELRMLQSAKPSSEIFDISAITAKAHTEDMLKKFVDQVTNVNLSRVDIVSMIERVAVEAGVEQDVKDLAINKYHEVSNEC